MTQTSICVVPKLRLGSDQIIETFGVLTSLEKLDLTCQYSQANVDLFWASGSQVPPRNSHMAEESTNYRLAHTTVHMYDLDQTLSVIIYALFSWSCEPSDFMGK